MAAFHLVFCFMYSLLKFGNGEWIDAMENDGLFEGDIVLTPDQRLEIEKQTSAKGYATLATNHWQHGKPIAYDSSGLGFLGKRAVENAISQYHKHTCIRFKPRTNERAYIRFYSGSGCHSPVGYRGGVNSISLPTLCQKTGTAIHEIAHSLGIYHEQSRPDRDQYVTINWQNIKNGKSGNFRKHVTNIDSLGFPYDYKSVMHYSGTAFGTGLIFKSKTITTRDRKYQNVIGQRRGFSEIDIQQINKMYGCIGGVTPTQGPSQGPPTGDCVDKERDCYNWAQDGYCTDKTEANYMKNNCCKSCKESARCPNKNSRCVEWAERGECTANPNYMLRMCKQACKVC